MWLLRIDLGDGVKIMRGRNGREYKVPELPHFSVYFYCTETRAIMNF